MPRPGALGVLFRVDRPAPIPDGPHRPTCLDFQNVGAS
jgi:hypothetical protein